MNIISYSCSIVLICLSLAGVRGYQVIGNKLYDPNGDEVLLRGIDRPSFEWNIEGQYTSLADYTLMKQWGANVIRVPLNQDFWLNNPSIYPPIIDQQVQMVNSLGMGIILDLHWNNGEQQNMADRNSITFWTQLGTRYKNNPWVMFELYNEPHDVSWSVWLNGDGTYAGMQELYNAVRSTGANNAVIVGGLNWAFDLSGVARTPVQGTNIAYATHPYDYDGKQKGNWDAAFGYLVDTYPVIMTEFGQYCNKGTYVADLLEYAESGLAHKVHWTAWGWFVSGCSFPSIISDWDGTPIAGVGELVRSYLQGTYVASSSSEEIPIPTSSSTITSASSELVVYDGNSLSSGWEDWSWSTSYSLYDTTYAYSGKFSIKFTVKNYQGIYFHTTSPFAIGAYESLQFYVNGGSTAISASALYVRLYTGSTGTGNSVTFPAFVPANQWILISIPKSSFGISDSTLISGVAIGSNVDSTAGNVWIDDIAFIPAATSTASSSESTEATAAPTSAPTPVPTSAATPAPPSAATSAPQLNSGCDMSSVQLAQASTGSWASGDKTIAQYNLLVSHTCPDKNLVALTLAATGWNPMNFWNAVSSTSDGQTVLSLPTYAAISSSNPYTIGYQNIGGSQATFTVTSATFQ